MKTRNERWVFWSAFALLMTAASGAAMAAGIVTLDQDKPPARNGGMNVAGIFNTKDPGFESTCWLATFTNLTNEQGYKWFTNQRNYSPVNFAAPHDTDHDRFYQFLTTQWGNVGTSAETQKKWWDQYYRSTRLREGGELVEHQAKVVSSPTAAYVKGLPGDNYVKLGVGAGGGPSHAVTFSNGFMDYTFIKDSDADWMWYDNQHVGHPQDDNLWRDIGPTQPGSNWRLEKDESPDYVAHYNVYNCVVNKPIPVTYVGRVLFGVSNPVGLAETAVQAAVPAGASPAAHFYAENPDKDRDIFCSVARGGMLMSQNFLRLDDISDAPLDAFSLGWDTYWEDFKYKAAGTSYYFSISQDSPSNDNGKRHGDIFLTHPWAVLNPIPVAGNDSPYRREINMGLTDGGDDLDALVMEYQQWWYPDGKIVNCLEMDVVTSDLQLFYSKDGSGDIFRRNWNPALNGGDGGWDNEFAWKTVADFMDPDLINAGKTDVDALAINYVNDTTYLIEYSIDDTTGLGANLYSYDIEEGIVYEHGLLLTAAELGLQANDNLDALSITPMPEPSTLLLLVPALLGFAGVLLRRKR